MKRLTLNGQLVEGEKLALRRGVNELRILYASDTEAELPVSENNYGCYFRLSDAAGNRMKDVRFERTFRAMISRFSRDRCVKSQAGFGQSDHH